MNYAIAKAISSLRSSPDSALAQPQPQPATMALPVAVAQPIRPAGADASAPPQATTDGPTEPPDPATPTRAHFQRSLGSFNLRSSQPTALLVTRRHRKFDAVSDAVRAHGCAFAASS
eukprot:240202-Pleurochrysis_carterae.AAC.1